MPIRRALQLRSGLAQGTRLKNKTPQLGRFIFRCGLPRASFATAKRVEWRWGEMSPRAEGYYIEIYILSTLFCLN
jgi:hypothetical protein